MSFHRRCTRVTRVSVRAAILVIAASVSACAHRAPVETSTPAPTAVPKKVLLTSSAPWTLPAAEPVELTDPQERIVYAVFATYPTGLSPAHERQAAKVLVAEARRHGFDPFLLLGLIRVESSVHNFAVSSVEARGLMQIRGFVGRDLAKGTGVVWHGDETLHDPIVNIRLGVKYLAQLRARFGDLDLALAAYNYGPTRLDRLLKRGIRPTDYATKIRWFEKHYGALSVPGNDLAPGVANVTLGTASLERKIRGRPAVALALARGEKATKRRTGVATTATPKAKPKKDSGGKPAAVEDRPVLALLDLNAASFGELLEAIPDLTPAEAKAVIEYREKSGGFRTIDDLDRVPGLSTPTRRALRARCCVERDMV